MGTIWEAAKLCQSYSNSGLMMINSRDMIAKAKEALRPEQEGDFFTASARIYDEQAGYSNYTVFRNPLDFSMLTDVPWKYPAIDPRNSLGELALIYRGGLINCRVPPLTVDDVNVRGIKCSVGTENITPISSGNYTFGTKATYECPLGKVFDETISRHLIAECRGPIGWERPVLLSCVSPGATMAFGNKTYTLYNATASPYQSFKAEEYCNSVNRSLATITSPEVLEELGGFLSEKGLSGAMVGNNISAWTPDWVPNDRFKCTVLKYVTKWGFDSVYCMDTQEKTFICESTPSVCLFQSLTQFAPKQAWKLDFDPAPNITLRYGTILNYTCRGVENTGTVVSTMCLGKLAWQTLLPKFGDCPLYKPYTFLSNGSDNGVLKSAAKCASEQGLQLPLITNSAEIGHVLSQVPDEEKNVRNPTVMIPVRNNALFSAQTEGITDFTAAMTKLNITDPNIWLPGEPKADAKFLCSYLLNRNGSWGLANFECSEQHEGKVTIVCGLAKATNCTIAPPKQNNRTGTASPAPDSNGAYVFEATNSYPDCNCGMMEVNQTGSVTVRTSTCYGNFGWYPYSLGPCVPGTKKCGGLPSEPKNDSHMQQNCSVNDEISHWSLTCVSDYKWANSRSTSLGRTCNEDTGNWTEIQDTCVPVTADETTSADSTSASPTSSTSVSPTTSTTQGGLSRANTMMSSSTGTAATSTQTSTEASSVIASTASTSLSASRGSTSLTSKQSTMSATTSTASNSSAASGTTNMQQGTTISSMIVSSTTITGSTASTSRITEISSSTGSSSILSTTEPITSTTTAAGEPESNNETILGVSSFTQCGRRPSLQEMPSICGRNFLEVFVEKGDATQVPNNRVHEMLSNPNLRMVPKRIEKAYALFAWFSTAVNREILLGVSPEFSQGQLFRKSGMEETRKRASLPRS
ncbi:unnamed protein product [Notodromas monacha]|uniref:Uncharacterized protein n=1 Tax=Notodromas monacha TaxID=399045 RepID=A0A7R9GH46_9CRUS|nr:unnamed protein product [Notodromas monacha]CAG0920534.1 unnamed protein product [Notodromas monacha]